jgi:hypothetical protein
MTESSASPMLKPQMSQSLSKDEKFNLQAAAGIDIARRITILVI